MGTPIGSNDETSEQLTLAIQGSQEAKRLLLSPQGARGYVSLEFRFQVSQKGPVTGYTVAVDGAAYHFKRDDRVNERDHHEIELAVVAMPGVDGMSA